MKKLRRTLLLKENKSMGFGMVLAGFILLFNPMIHVIDIIPDVIGFLLIAVGLRKTSFFVSRIDDARRMFWKLVIIEGIKLPSFLFIPYGSMVPHQQGSTQVLLTFVFALVELIAFIPAINYLFEGIAFAGTTYNGSLMYEPKIKKRLIIEPYEKSGDCGKKTSSLRLVTKKRKVELVTSAKVTVIAFYIFRNIMTLIPELTELEMYEFVGNVSTFSRPLTYYKPVLYVLSFIAVIVFGIIYIKKISKLVNSLKKDRPFMEAIIEKYERDIVPKKTLFMSLDVKTSIILFAFSVGTSFAFYLDGINVLVGCISAGFLIVAAVILGKYVKFAKFSIPFSAIRAALAIYNIFGEARYFSEYGDAFAVEFFEKAYDMYYPLAALKVVEAVFALASMLIFIFSIIRAVREHLPICGLQVENAQYSKKSRDAEIYSLIKGKMILSAVFTVVNFIMAALYLYLLVYLEAMIVISSLVTIVWAVYTIYSLVIINANLYDREIETV